MLQRIPNNPLNVFLLVVTRKENADRSPLTGRVRSLLHGGPPVRIRLGENRWPAAIRPPVTMAHAHQFLVSGIIPRYV